LTEKAEIMEKHRQAALTWWSNKKAETVKRVAALF
jgi:hypothetical protein